MGKLVEVTVAKRRSIQQRNKAGERSKVYLEGETCFVDESELDRLYSAGFIVDPHAKTLTPDEVSAADLAMVSEQTTQSIKQGRR